VIFSSGGRYPEIGDYGMVGDLRSAALISKQGSIDWMCLPRFDSPSVFGRILDWEKGGYLQIAPVRESTSFRQYRTSSNVLETTWTHRRSRMRVVDFMPIRVQGKASNPPGSLRLVRIIQPLNGAMDWQLTFSPRFDYGRQQPTFKLLSKGILEATSGNSRLVLQYPHQLGAQLHDGTAVVVGRCLPGQPAAILLHYLEAGRRPSLVSFDQAKHFLERTDSYWFSWLKSCRYRGRFADPVRRSALVLKMMQYLPSGAFVAAPTTSLPEHIGGQLNWDYRYTWLRDTSILVSALYELGFEDEATGFMQWLNRVHRRHPTTFQMTYRIDGGDRLPEITLDHLTGYRNSRPVRIGNQAVDQVQLDVYGEIMETAFATWRRRKRLPQPRRQTLLTVVDYVLEHWLDEDSGIWEARRHKRRYLYSRVMCWAALERALRMDGALRMGVRRRKAVRETRSQIKREVLNRGFNKQIGAFTQALDSQELDATALVVPLSGLLPPDDPRVVSTVAVLQQQLTANGFLYRYAPQKSEFHEPEGAFIICTLWLVEVLALMGRQQDAEELFGRVTEAANDLGLLAEEYDPKGQLMLGNFPQALSHLCLIDAVLYLERGSSGKPGRSRAGIARRSA
jgi:GH15 family glucan-1,4-alpha-glucosidase